MFEQAIAQTEWADWQITPLAGDASSRHYARLTDRHGNSAIVMIDAPHQGNGTVAFARIAQALGAHGHAAPEVFFHDADRGIMIISDLGQVDVAAHLSQAPGAEDMIYTTAVDTLLHLHSAKASIELASLDAETAAKAVDLAAIHYAAKPQNASELIDAMREAIDANVSASMHFALRDFHAENLIWRPNEQGQTRLGLLDFQDACLAPAGYDLMSLLRDARRDVDPLIAARLIKRFQRSVPKATDSHLATISVQRNLRILGIFARLSTHGKPDYLALLPRVWGHLIQDLSHPDLHKLRDVVLRHLPPPSEAGRS